MEFSLPKHIAKITMAPCGKGGSSVQREITECAVKKKWSSNNNPPNASPVNIELGVFSFVTVVVIFVLSDPPFFLY